MMRLFVVEVRRALARGVTRMLLLLAVIGIGVAGVWVFAATKDADAARQQQLEIQQRNQERDAAYDARDVQVCVEGVNQRYPHRTAGSVVAPAGPATGGDQWAPVYAGTAGPELIDRYCTEQARARSGSSSYTPPVQIFHLTQLWVDDANPDNPATASATSPPSSNRSVGDSILVITSTLLFVGALIGGASLVGSEWQTGSFVVFLTWEPRRVRVLLVKVLAAAVLAALFAFALQALLGLVLYPTALVKGSTDGMTAHWFGRLLVAMLRISAITAMAAAIGSSLAMIGRRTALALGAAFLYLAIGESLIGAWQTGLRPVLLGINTAIFLTGQDLSSEDFTRSTTTAGLTLLAYTAGFVLLAAVAFRRRDFASG